MALLGFFHFLISAGDEITASILFGVAIQTFDLPIIQFKHSIVWQISKGIPSDSYLEI